MSIILKSNKLCHGFRRGRFWRMLYHINANDFKLELTSTLLLMYLSENLFGPNFLAVPLAPLSSSFLTVLSHPCQEENKSHLCTTKVISSSHFLQSLTAACIYVTLASSSAKGLLSVAWKAFFFFPGKGSFILHGNSCANC